MGVAVTLVVVAVRGRANAPHEASQHIDRRYHGQHDRGNEQRKPDGAMVVGMPKNHGEQHGGDKQHEVAPVVSLGEVSGLAPKLPTLLLSHKEGVDVLSDHSLERDSTGYLVFRNPLQQLQL